MEAGSQADMEWDGLGQRDRRLLCEPGIDDDWNEEGGEQDAGIRVDDDRDLARFHGRFDPVCVYEPGGHALDGVFSVVDGLGKGNSAPHRQGLWQLTDNHLQAGTVQP